MRFLRFRRHPVSEEELSACLDGRLGDSQLERVEAHVQSCADCGRKLEEMRSLIAEMRHLPEAKAPRSFAISPETAAIVHREGDRVRQRERMAVRRAYVSLSGATVLAAFLLFAVVGSDIAFFSNSSEGQNSAAMPATLSRDAASAPETLGQGDNAVEKGTDSTATGEGDFEGAVPGAAPPPTAVATDQRSAVEVTPSPVETPSEMEAAQAPSPKDNSHLWLWIVEGATGGFVIGLGVSAFWMRRRWLQINRS